MRALLDLIRENAADEAILGACQETLLAACSTLTILNPALGENDIELITSVVDELAKLGLEGFQDPSSDGEEEEV